MSGSQGAGSESATGLAPGRPALALRALTKRFGDVAAVDGVDLEVMPGEFITLLGPSGSGKTTTLRIIAGFTAQTSGTIDIDGLDMSNVPPYRRDVGMVFQNYALFPHMTAAENIAFPLEMRNAGKAEIKRRVAEALQLVQLPYHGDRYPRQLSGGQQQRIALARAIVFRPRLLLMDEPLGALDKKLRESLELEILHISRQVGATVVYVTHDQEEALVMSDRIAIFRDGRIEQAGTGEDLYDRPASLFVADFIGESNILRGRFTRDGTGGWLVREGWRGRISPAAMAGAGVEDGAAAALVVRPERLEVRSADEPDREGENSMAATIRDILFLGSLRKYELVLPTGEPLVVRSPIEPTSHRPGEAVRVAWAVERGVLVADPAA